MCFKVLVLNVYVLLLSAHNVHSNLSGPNSPAVTEEAESSEPRFRPIVLWHGIGDSCCDPDSVGAVKEFLEEVLPGVYVLSIMIGFTIHQDKKNSVLMGANRQVKYVCNKLKKDPNLANGYNAIGFSQGAQFLRAVAQRCPDPRMFNLISIGGQHQGISRLLVDKYSRFGEKHRYILYWWITQQFLSVAGYWHDPLEEEEYRKHNTFLADINNERVHKRNKEYKQNLLKLENLVLVKFTLDSVVDPVDTQWFEFYKPGQDVEILPLKESKLWTEDRIGLRELDRTGRLHFLEKNGDHLEYNDVWMYRKILPFLIKE